MITAAGAGAVVNHRWHAHVVCGPDDKIDTRFFGLCEWSAKLRDQMLSHLQVLLARLYQLQNEPVEAITVPDRVEQGAVAVENAGIDRRDTASPALFSCSVVTVSVLGAGSVSRLDHVHRLQRLETALKPLHRRVVRRVSDILTVALTKAVLT